MRSINRVVLMGHLAADPELRQTKSGVAVVQFPLAVNYFVKAKDGERSEMADFHRIIAFRGLADICDKYLSKGMAVYVEGKLMNNSFEDKEGKKHYRTEIVADNLNIITWKKSKQGGEVSIESVSETEAEEELVSA
ncbi:MAG: single-stranded DNA-binding protein [Candidatus Gracilibacteria bacterium]|nr:single-stranded DNA-binding protein [Candidatus Gracilibacteria bacterium]